MADGLPLTYGEAQEVRDQLVGGRGEEGEEGDDGLKLRAGKGSGWRWCGGEGGGEEGGRKQRTHKARDEGDKDAVS